MTIGFTPGVELLFRFDLGSSELTLLVLACLTWGTVADLRLDLRAISLEAAEDAEGVGG